MGMNCCPPQIGVTPSIAGAHGAFPDSVDGRTSFHHDVEQGSGPFQSSAMTLAICILPIAEGPTSGMGASSVFPDGIVGTACVNEEEVEQCSDPLQASTLF